MLILLATLSVLLASWLHSNATQPGSQEELDVVRGYAPNQWPFFEIQEKNDAYYAAATGISYARDDCGKSVTDAISIRWSHTFSNDVIMFLSQDRLRRVEHQHDFPLAYLPERYGPIRNGDPLVFNPKVRQVSIRKSESRLSTWSVRGVWAWIDYSGVLKLPMSDFYEPIVTDGSGVTIMICRNGLHYDFRRSLSGALPEPQLAALIHMLQKHSATEI